MEAAVIHNAVKGSCPCAQQKAVTAKAPSPAETKSYRLITVSTERRTSVSMFSRDEEMDSRERGLGSCMALTRSEGLVA